MRRLRLKGYVMTTVLAALLLMGTTVLWSQGRGGARGGDGGGGGRVLSKLIEGPDLGYKPVPNPLPLPAGMSFGALGGVVINSQQHIFVFTGTRPELTQNGADPLPLVEFDADGKFVRAWGKELGSSSPHGFRLDSSDNFWLTDIGNHTVTKLNPKGEVVLTLGTKGKSRNLG